MAFQKEWTPSTSFIVSRLETEEIKSARKDTQAENSTNLLRTHKSRPNSQIQSKKMLVGESYIYEPSTIIPGFNKSTWLLKLFLEQLHTLELQPLNEKRQCEFSNSAYNYSQRFKRKSVNWVQIGAGKAFSIRVKVPTAIKSGVFWVWGKELWKNQRGSCAYT